MSADNVFSSCSQKKQPGSSRIPDHLQTDTAVYWDSTAELYQSSNVISCKDFHYGPLIPGDHTLQLLPDRLEGLRCMELGSGAGQNSIYLAMQEASCIALDISLAMIQHGSRLSEDHGVTVQFELQDLDQLSPAAYEPVDLVHSTFSLPFVKDPSAMIKHAYELLRPGGQFLLSTGHPLYAGEWIEVDDQEAGLFLPDYFGLTDETRTDAGLTGRARYVPLEQLFTWCRQAGFSVEQFCEPRAVELRQPTPCHIPESVPYWSDEWLELYPVLRRIPIVAVFSLRKPA